MSLGLNLTLKPTSSGSATGNPRNKCALKPGHSLMDWIRLGNSGADLSGTRGRIIPVSMEELSKHNTQADAWMAIRGNVYNVTRYKDFHPGGIDELMRGVGKDATKLFDEVHAWVNYAQLLQKCYIGPLKQKTSSDAFKAPKLALPPVPSLVKSVNSEIVPRFDWIQKRNDISFNFYTKQFCNPGVIIQRETDKDLKVSVQIAQQTHVFKVTLHKHIMWPPQSALISSESGKIELKFVKSIPELWTTYGEHTLFSSKETNLIFEDFQIVHRQQFNADSIELCLQPKKDIIYLLPVGYHVAITAQIQDATIQRNFTPVAAKYLKSKIDQNESSAFNLNFLIKIYEQGIMSTHLKQLNIDTPLQVSSFKGSFSLQQLLPFRHIILLAAGSGITPFLHIIEHLLGRNSNRIEELYLYYFNKTECDIWCREHFEELQLKDARFHLTNMLSAAPAHWTGLCGRISKDLLQNATSKDNQPYFVLVCGPPAFNECVVNILRDLNFNTKENLYVF